MNPVDRKPVQSPGKRGGKYYRDKQGSVQYGQQPQERSPAQGDALHYRPGRKVAFRGWDGKTRTGRVTASGQHGSTIRTGSGERHPVLHNMVHGELDGGYSDAFMESVEKFPTSYKEFVTPEAQAEGDRHILEGATTGYNIDGYAVGEVGGYGALLMASLHPAITYAMYSAHNDHGRDLLEQMGEHGLSPEYDVVQRASSVLWDEKWDKEPELTYEHVGGKLVGRSHEYIIAFRPKDQKEAETVADFLESHAHRGKAGAVKHSWEVPDIRSGGTADNFQSVSLNTKKVGKQEILILTKEADHKLDGYTSSQVFINPELAQFIKALPVVTLGETEPDLSPVETWVYQWGAGILAAISQEMLDLLGGKPEPKYASWLGSLRDFFAKSAYARTRNESMNAWGARIMRRVQSRGYWSLRAAEVQDIAEYVIQQHFPRGIQGNQARAVAVRSYLAGKIQENFDRYGVDPVPYDIETLPVTIEAAGKLFRLDRKEHNTIEFAEAFAGQAITNLRASTRNAIHTILLNGIQNHLDPGKIQSMLFDRFGALNRDWQRVAITEVRSALVNGYLASLPPGTRVKRTEMPNCCPHCLPFNGRIYTVRDPGDPNKDWVNDVWVGKTNIGRSGSPRRIEDGQLVARTPDELYVIAPLIHPNCRGGFVAMNERPTNPQLQSLYDLNRQRLQESGLAAIMRTYE